MKEQFPTGLKLLKEVEQILKERRDWVKAQEVRATIKQAKLSLKYRKLKPSKVSK